MPSSGDTEPTSWAVEEGTFFSKKPIKGTNVVGNRQMVTLLIQLLGLRVLNHGVLQNLKSGGI